MMLLKDLRFYLIVGLAGVCLLTLKTFSTAQGMADSVAVIPADETAVISSEAEQAVEQPQQTVQQPVEKVAEIATGKTTTANDSAMADTSAETAAEPAPAVADITTGTEDAAISVGVASALPAMPSVSVIQAIPAIKEIPVIAAEMPPIEVDKIVLRDPSATGSAIADLKADISSLENGLYQYSEKSDRVSSLINKIKGIAQ